MTSKVSSSQVLGAPSPSEICLEGSSDISGLGDDFEEPGDIL